MKSNPPSVILTPTTFPSVLIPDSEKATKEYGIRIGSAISWEWFSRSGQSCRFYDQWINFNRLRLYARGEQPIGKYKNLFTVNGSLEHINLDWTIVPAIPNFVDMVVNGMSERLYKVRAEAVDIMSAEKKNAFQDMVEANMNAKEALLNIQKDFGVNGFDIPQGDVPDDQTDLNLYMQLNYKPSIEIAEECAIDTVMQMNKYDDIKKRVTYDIVTLGVGIEKHEFLINKGIDISYVDPANVVYSYTESPTFDDVFYWGEVKRVPLTELYKINPNISKDEMAEIAMYGSAWYDYYTIMQPYRNDLFQRDTVTLLYFNYKTTHNFAYKKKKLANGMEKVIKKGSDFNPEPNDKFEKVSIPKDVWYEGILVMGSNILLKWEMAKNMVRPESPSQEAISQYVARAPRMYKGRFESLTSRMIPFADQVQLGFLKKQQILSRLIPDGVFLDADGINEVDLGTGANYNPEDAMRMFFQTGSVIGRSMTQDGEFNHAKIPIQEINTNSGQSKLVAINQEIDANLNMMASFTGITKNAANPDPDGLVGLQKLAAANSNQATRHILQATLGITRDMATAISFRLADVLQYADFKDELAMQIGKYSVAVLDDVKNLPLHSFAIFIDVAPDEEEKALLEQNINMALTKENINLEDAIDIRSVNNIKLANELLKKKRKDRDKQKMLDEKARVEMQTQGNIQSANAANQAKIQYVQADGQQKMGLAQSEHQFKMEQMREEANLKKELMGVEFGYQMQLKGTVDASVEQREDKKETAKDKRTEMQATQQSKLIEQRQRNLPAQNFESTNDSMFGDISLAEFEPR